MTFINEHISTEDQEKYQLEKIDKKFVVGGTNSRTWTVDKGRDIYLREVSVGREEFRHLSKWTLYLAGRYWQVNALILL